MSQKSKNSDTLCQPSVEAGLFTKRPVNPTSQPSQTLVGARLARDSGSPVNITTTDSTTSRITHDDPLSFISPTVTNQSFF